MPSIGRLRVEIDAALGRMQIPARVFRAWAVVNRSGSHHGLHVHDAEASAIYFVTPGSAKTVFEMPDGERAIDPVPGTAVLFAGRVRHRVERELNDAPRIAIALDASRPRRP